MRDSKDQSKQRAASRIRLGISGLRGVLIGTGEPAPPASPASSKAAKAQLSGRLAGMSLRRQVAVLAIWPLLEQLLNFLVGTVDFAIAGRLPGDEAPLDAIEAMSVASYFVWLMTILQAAVGVGASAIVSRAIGAKHRRLANAGAGQAVLLGVGSGVVAAALIFALAPWIAGSFDLNDNATDMASDYIRLTALGIPMCGALFVGGSVLRAAGDTRSPFLAMLLVNVINVIASVGLGGLRLGEGDEQIILGLGLGVTGIALGTAMAWTAGGLIVLAMLLSGRSGIRVRRHRLIPHLHTLRRITRVAMPNLYYQLAFWLINFGLLIYINRLAVEGALGAHSIAMRIHSVSFLPGYAISIAASTLTGQYLGLGDPKRAKEATFLALRATLVLMLVCSMCFYFLPEQLVALLSPDTKEHLALAPPLLKIAAFATPLLAVNLILAGSVQGAGDTRNSAIINLTGLVTVRLGGAYVLAFVFGLGLWGIWLAIMTDIAVRGLAFAVYYRTGRWQRAAV